MSHTPEDQMKALWQGQDQEVPTMTVAAIRMLVKDNEARQRHMRTFGLGVAVFATSVWVWCAWTAPTPLVRIGDLVMLGWLPVMLLILYRRRPGRAPGPETSAQGLLEFYRAEPAADRPLTGAAVRRDGPDRQRDSEEAGREARTLGPGHAAGGPDRRLGRAVRLPDPPPAAPRGGAPARDRRTARLGR